MRAAMDTALVVAIVLAASAALAEPPLVAATRAGEHVGEEVTVEGRVVATHVSQLATVFAFAPNFAGFTASILAADRAKFPTDVAERARDRMVRLTGTVGAYRKKPEMVLREPAQLVVLATGGGGEPAPPAPSPSPAASDAALQEMRRLLARLEGRIAALEARVAELEPVSPARPESIPGPGAPTEAPASFGVGTPAAEVRALLGDPPRVRRAPNGTVVWSYGPGRTITFDRRGQVTAWRGF